MNSQYPLILKNPKELKKQKTLPKEVVNKIGSLLTASFGLAAALAWNEAIKKLFAKYFPEESGILAHIVYASGVTLIAAAVIIAIENQNKKST